MSDTLHSFRCPVCGHVDEASTGPGETTVDCSHCGTSLKLASSIPGSMGVEARVGEQPGPKDHETPPAQ